jgi:hypothetical protein
VAGGISGGSIGIHDNGVDAALFPQEPDHAGMSHTASQPRTSSVLLRVRPVST